MASDKRSFKDVIGTRFAVNVPCFIKKETIPVVIVEVLGKGKWKVAKVDETGQVMPSLLFERTSQQLRKPKKDDWDKGNVHPLIHPPLASPHRPTILRTIGQELNRMLSPATTRRNEVSQSLPSSSSHCATNNPTGSHVRDTSNIPPRDTFPSSPTSTQERLLTPIRSPNRGSIGNENAPDESAIDSSVGAPPHNLSEANCTSPTAVIDGGSRNFRQGVDIEAHNLDEQEVNDAVTVGIGGSGDVQGSDHETSISGDDSLDDISATEEQDADDASLSDNEENPDLEFEEDIPHRPRDELDGEDAEENSGAIGQAVEQADDKYTERFNKYLAERESLVQSGLTISVKASKKKSIEIGARIKVRNGPFRGKEGLVVKKDAERLWGVKFDDELDAIYSNISSSSLTLVHDKRIFKWKCVDESFPVEPIQEFRDVGVVGFNFNQFAEHKLSIDNDDYEFPYLKLLIHLWPGKKVYYCIPNYQ